MNQLLSTPWPRQARGLFFVAMAIFLVTILIGIVNGLDLYDFNRDQVLTHVHSGTLGWITLGLVAAVFWLFRSGDARLATALAIVVPIYVAAFYTGSLPARAVTGTVLLVVILWLIVWAWRSAMADRSLPGLAVALALTTFTYGAIIGVLLQIQGATATLIFPANADAIGGHAAAMVFSYLILAAMGLLEWRLVGTTGRPTAGLAQVALLFVGGLMLSFTLLFLDEAATQAIGGIYLLVELIAVVLFGVRVLRVAIRVDWRSASAERHFATSAVFVVVAMAIFMYVVALFIQNPDPAAIPVGVLIASDHSAFIGVITNLLLGLGLALSADRRADLAWADQIVFWGTNLGLLVFLGGLVSETVVLKQVGAPVMGLALLLGLAVVTLRLRDSSLAAAEA